MPTKTNSQTAQLKQEITALKKSVAELKKALTLVSKYALKGRAFSPKEETAMQTEMGKLPGIRLGNWKCGDYLCITGGTLFNAGTTSEIAFPWGIVCPTLAKLSDGSQWQFQGNCHSC